MFDQQLVVAALDTTHPGSRLWFPSLCRPTAPITVNPDAPTTADTNRGLAMPRRTATRAQNRAKAIDEQRAANHAVIAAQAEHHNHGTPHDDNPPTTRGINDYFPTTPPPPNPDDPPPF